MGLNGSQILQVWGLFVNCLYSDSNVLSISSQIRPFEFFYKMYFECFISFCYVIKNGLRIVCYTFGGLYQTLVLYLLLIVSVFNSHYYTALNSYTFQPVIVSTVPNKYYQSITKEICMKKGVKMHNVKFCSCSEQILLM